MATLALSQMYFAFMPPPVPLPVELHNIKENRAYIGQLVNTVRRGDKWAKVPKGHLVQLTHGSDHEFMGIGQVVKTWKAPFNQVLATVLDRNHSGPQSYSSALSAMRRAYGENFREDEVVVFLDYKRIS